MGYYSGGSSPPSRTFENLLYQRRFFLLKVLRMKVDKGTISVAKQRISS